MDNTYDNGAIARTGSMRVSVSTLGPATTAMPRELGINERVCGLEAGLHNLVCKLEAFAERVDGGGTCAANDGKDAPAPTALRPTLTRVESLLRRAHEITTALGEAF